MTRFDLADHLPQQVDVVHQQTVSVAFGKVHPEEPGCAADVRPSVFCHSVWLRLTMLFRDYVGQPRIT